MYSADSRINQVNDEGNENVKRFRSTMAQKRRMSEGGGGNGS